MEARAKRHAHELGVHERDLAKALDVDHFARRKALAEMLYRHQDMANAIAHQMRLQAMRQDPAFVATFSWPGPADAGQASSYAHLSPIMAADLTPGMTHRGRVLRLRSLDSPVSISGTVLPCVDARGDPVVVSIYNCLPTNIAFPDRQAAAAKKYPSGSCIAILDPFFKVAADGSYAVRVEDPSKVIDIPDLAPMPAADLQEMGRQAFLRRDYRGAAGCYSDALASLLSQPPPNDALLVIVLCNLSSTHMALNPSGCGPGAALRYALSAARIAAGTPAAAKPYYRMAIALGCIPGCGAAASAALAEALDRWQPPPSDEEQRNMQARVAEGATHGGSGSSGGTTRGAAADQLRTALASNALGTTWEVEVAQEEAEVLKEGSGEGATTDTQAAIETAVAEKEAGTAAFRAGKHAEALVHYRRALRALTGVLPVATLLSNRAACGLFGDGVAVQHEALLDACAALVLAPRVEKAHYRRAKTLQLMGKTTQALEMVELGMRLCDGGSADGLPSLKAALRP